MHPIHNVTLKLCMGPLNEYILFLKVIFKYFQLWLICKSDNSYIWLGILQTPRWILYTAPPGYKLEIKLILKLIKGDQSLISISIILKFSPQIKLNHLLFIKPISRFFKNKALIILTESFYSFTAQEHYLVKTL